MAKERWKKVPGWSIYEVSDRGRVRSRDHVVIFRQRRKGQLLRGSRARNGYRMACLRLPEGGERGMLIHRLVLWAFCGPPLKGQQCRHLNGKRTDNRLQNLRWGTAKQNQRDRKRHGTDICGEKHWKARLSEKQVRKIRADERTQSAIGRAFGIAQTNVSAIKRRETWRHLD